jgi:hypothetical protein
MTSRRVLAIDPGLMTGMACFTWESGSDPVLEWSAEVDENHYAAAIRYEFQHYPHIEIVCERFTINAQTAKKSQAPFSLELIGALKLIVRDNGRASTSITLQAPADAMNLFPNPALKKLGYWHKGGAGHAMDAIRHGLLYLAKQGWPPKGLLK